MLLRTKFFTSSSGRAVPDCSDQDDDLSEPLPLRSFSHHFHRDYRCGPRSSPAFLLVLHGFSLEIQRYPFSQLCLVGQIVFNKFEFWKYSCTATAIFSETGFLGQLNCYSPTCFPLSETRRASTGARLLYLQLLEPLGLFPQLKTFGRYVAISYLIVPNLGFQRNQEVLFHLQNLRLSAFLSNSHGAVISIIATPFLYPLCAPYAISWLLALFQL